MADPIHDTPEADLWVACKAGDRAARTELIRRHLWYVDWWVVEHTSWRGLLDAADAVAAGRVGLIRAVDEYDFARGAKLTTLAKYWVPHEISRACRGEAAARRAKAAAAEGQLREPIDEHTPDLDVEAHEVQARYTRALERILPRLSRRGRAVVRRRWLVTPQETHRSIAKRMGISRQRVVQIEACARELFRAELELT